MPHLKDLSDQPAVISAIEANMFTFWLNYGRLPGREVYEDARLLRFATGVPFPLFNAVFRAQLSPAEIDTTITATLQSYAARRLPLFWWTGPATRPADLGTVLQKYGLHHAGNTPGMAGALSALPTSLPTLPDFTIHPVEDEAALRQWVTVLTVGNGLPYMLHPAIEELEVSRGIGQTIAPQRYLGVYKGKPVAASALHLDAGVGGLYSVATILEARGHGFGAAVSLQPLLDARALGYSVGVLQASEMGFPVYQRLGFTTFCQLGIYVFAGSR